jgi:hypothetical protein
MNKKIISAAFIFIIISNAKAQDDMREETMLGIKVGANYSNVYDSYGEAFVADPKFGLAWGGFLSIPLDKVIGLQPEVLFSQKGFRANGVLLSNNYGLTRTTSFIDVPIFFAVKPTPALTLLIGPQYSYLIRQKDVVDNGTNSVAQEQEFENDNIRRNILCFAAGGDINIDHSVFSGRIGWDIQNNKGDGTSSTPRYKNIWYQFTIGYRFY